MCGYFIGFNVLVCVLKFEYLSVISRGLNVSCVLVMFSEFLLLMF